MKRYSQQNINSADIDAVIDVLNSDYLTQGPKINEFERSVASYTNAKYAVAVNSATSALHLGCLALGLGAGDILWTVPNTFVATASCALYCGALVDFVDINPVTFNISVEKLEMKLRAARISGNLPKILIPVHFAGCPVDLEEIFALAEEYNFHVLEDGSHALGAEYKNSKIGSCSYSDATVFSFHPVKNITSGEGGVLTTNSGDIYKKAKMLGSHGINRDFDHIPATDKPVPWYYQQVEVGWNYRLSDIHAALGVSQMKELDNFRAMKASIALRYISHLNDLPLEFQFINNDRSSGFHLFVLKLNEIGVQHSLYNYLKNNGIGTGVHYIPVHEQPLYKKFGFKKGMFPNSEEFYRKTLSIPFYPYLSKSDQDFIISSIKNFFNNPKLS